jgi:hypothetical protein
LAAPGHIPWGDVEDVPTRSWIPEGSSYPPDLFREALRNKRHLNNTNARNKLVPLRDVTLVPGPTIDAPCSKSDVLKHEFGNNMGCHTRNWSRHVPTVPMNPEMLDMVLQLKDLNSFFRGSMDDEDQSAQPARLFDVEKQRLVPPSLMVSDSESSVPIFFDSAGEPSMALATRRGRNMPPMLCVKPVAELESYDSIPTAFLGSSSTYSPKFEFANQAGQSSLDFETMVTSLKRQCASFQVHSPSVSFFPERKDVCERLHSADDNDEWAFARGLSDDPSADYKSQVTNIHRGPSPNFLLSDRVNSTTESSRTASQGSSDATAEFSNVPEQLSLGAQRFLHSPRTFAPPSAPPCAPLPAPPIQASSPKLMRGILKSCKSVRFASLPAKQDKMSTVVFDSPSPSSSRIAGTSVVARPSPLRISHSPRGSVTLFQNVQSTPTSPSPQMASRALHKFQRKGVSAHILASPLMSVPKSKTTSTKNSLPFRNFTTKQADSLGKKHPLQTSSLGRRSFGLTLSSPVRGKENKAAFPRWSTVNENAMRREPKPRMQMPLRSIFTRFK